VRTTDGEAPESPAASAWLLKVKTRACGAGVSAAAVPVRSLALPARARAFLRRCVCTETPVPRPAARAGPCSVVGSTSPRMLDAGRRG